MLGTIIVITTIVKTRLRRGVGGNEFDEGVARALSFARDVVVSCPHASQSDKRERGRSLLSPLTAIPPAARRRDSATYGGAKKQGSWQRKGWLLLRSGGGSAISLCG